MAVPMIIGFLIGHPLGAFIMTVCLRLVLVMNTAFFINSFAHSYGDRPYDSSFSARDHWIGAFLTNGEGYHNFHHKFPTDYRSGIRWFHFDPSKWIIYTLSKLNLAWDLKKTSQENLDNAAAQVNAETKTS
jgi:stearoyl-CoA desaturase (delta-9 desaturase)